MTDPAVRQLADGELFRIVHDGIPAKGMPAFDYISEEQIRSLGRYLRFLGGRAAGRFSTGNAARGQDLFLGKAGCSGCHMLHGQGGFLGADLTEYRATQTRKDEAEAILDPGQFYTLHQSALSKTSVEVITREGERLTGVVRNEDNFSLQLLGADGAIHMLIKSDMERVNRNANVIPLADSASRLSESELEDVFSYLNRDAQGRANESAVNIRDPHRKP